MPDRPVTPHQSHGLALLAGSVCFLLVLMAGAASAFLPAAYVGGWAAHVIARQAHAVDRFFPFDAVWYLRIAVEGYVWDPGQSGLKQDIAFFPAWPLLERAIIEVAPSFLAARWLALVCAACFAMASLLAFSQLAYRILPKRPAHFAIWLLALNPAAVFLLLSYPTGVMNLLCILTILAVMDQRFWAAALFSGLATACGPLGIGTAMMVFTCAAWSLADQYRLAVPSRAALLRSGLWLSGVALLSVSGLLIFLIWQQVALGDAFAFVKAQQAWEAAVPIVPRLYRTLTQILILPDFGLAITNLKHVTHPRNLTVLQLQLDHSLNLFAEGLGLIGILACTRFTPRAVVLQGMFTLAVFIWFHGAVRPGNSTIRLIYCATGMFLGWAWLLQRWPRLAVCVIALSACLLTGGALLLGAGYHFT